MATLEERIAALELKLGTLTPRRFPQGVDQVAVLNLLDKVLVGVNADGSAKVAAVNQIANLISATVGSGIEPTAEPNTTLPAPAQVGKIMIMKGGSYTQPGGGSLVAPANSFNVGYWDGEAWSIDISIETEADLSGYATASSVTNKQLNKVSANRYSRSKNVFDKNTLRAGYHMDINGVPIADANYLYSLPIPIETGATYRARSAIGNRGYRYLCAFDASMNPVPSSGWDSSASSTIEISDPDVRYVVLSVYYEDIDDFQVEVGSTPTAYVPFDGYDLLEGNAAIDWAGVITEGNKVKVSQVDFVKNTVNLFDPDSATPDKYVVYSTGNLATPAGSFDYNATDYIPVYGLSEITVNFTHQCAFYNASFGYISGINLVRAFTVDTLTVPVGAAYFRMGVEPTFMEQFMVVAGETLPDEYVPYGYELDTDKVKIPSETDSDVERAVSLIESVTGQHAAQALGIALSDNTETTLADFPYHIKKNVCLSASASFSSFPGKVLVGKGLNQYRGSWLEIDGTNIVWIFYESSATTMDTVAHGLTMDTFLNISLFIDQSSVCHVALHTLGGLFQTTFDWTYEFNYAVFFRTEGQALTDVCLNASCKDLQCPVWVFGDSYTGVATNRWPGQMKEIGFFNFMLDGLAGIASPSAFNELNRALNHGSPKYLLWCLGMNDTTYVSYSGVMSQLTSICTQRGITLILATIPTVPTRDKEEITTYVRGSGYRYIDFYKAVGADEEGNWYPGYLAGDGVHPTDAGAKALAMQILVDFPELMQYGITA